MSTTDKPQKSIFREYGEALAIALALALFLRAFFISAFTIPSGSMLQTIQLGDYILVNKLAYGLKLPFSDTWIYRGEGPQYGDIIVFRYPRDPSIDYIKRVVGLPGDVIEVRNKQFYRNGQKVEESYIQHTRPNFIGPLDNVGPITVGPDEYFAMGDNRDNSADSRDWGTVNASAIHGKAWRVYWSWDKEKGMPRLSRIFKKME